MKKTRFTEEQIVKILQQPSARSLPGAGLKNGHRQLNAGSNLQDCGRKAL